MQLFTKNPPFRIKTRGENLTAVIPFRTAPSAFLNLYRLRALKKDEQYRERQRNKLFCFTLSFYHIAFFV